MADLTTLQQKRYYDAIAYVDLGGIQGLPNDTPVSYTHLMA